MKFPFIIIVNKLHVKGMALYPFILLREKKFADDPLIMNHEKIHHKQEIELLILPLQKTTVISAVHSEWAKLFGDDGLVAVGKTDH